MAIAIVLVAILLSAIAVFAWLFYSIKREAQKAADEKAEPIMDIAQIYSAPAVASGKGTTWVSPAFKKKDEPVVADLSEIRSEAKSAAMPVFTPSTPSAAPDASALRLEASADEIAQLKEEVKLIREKAVMQAKNALEVINKLRDENDRLRTNVERLQSESQRPRQDEDMIHHLRAESAAFRTQSAAAAEETLRVKDQMETIQRELGQQMVKGSEAIARLEEENARLRSGGQVSAEHEKVVEGLRTEYQKQLDGFLADLDRLRRDNESLRMGQVVQSEKLAAQSFLSTEAVEGIKVDFDSLKKERESLEKRVKELEQVNNFQQDKNKFLQYELTKSRAQATGLERIYEGTKKRFEDVSREVHLSEKDNLALKKQTVSLEQNLEDFKKMSSALLRREKLAQFDLEKERA